VINAEESRVMIKNSCYSVCLGFGWAAKPVKPHNEENIIAFFSSGGSSRN
jgi:hypothetical protein